MGGSEEKDCANGGRDMVVAASTFERFPADMLMRLLKRVIDSSVMVGRVAKLMVCRSYMALSMVAPPESSVAVSG